MTQLILTQSNYLLSLLKSSLTKVSDILTIAFEAVIEARQRQANVEVARQLMGNRDFANYSFSEVLQMVEEGKRIK